VTVLTPFLRKVLPKVLCKVLSADTATSVAAGAILIGGADLAAVMLGLPPGLLFWSGVALIPFVATPVMLARAKSGRCDPRHYRDQLRLDRESHCVVFGPVLAPTIIGKVIVCAPVAAVFRFAELQVMGLRRISAMG